MRALKKWAKNTYVIFWGKNYNCDFSVLKIISQQKDPIESLHITTFLFFMIKYQTEKNTLPDIE